MFVLAETTRCESDDFYIHHSVQSPPSSFRDRYFREVSRLRALSTVGTAVVAIGNVKL